MGSVSAEGLDVTPAARERLLVVAADVAITAALDDALSTLGEVAVVAAEAALDAVQAGVPALVVLEASPDAPRLIQSLRERPETRLVPILVVGVSGPPAEAADLLAAGADDCLPARTPPEHVRSVAAVRLERARAWAAALAEAEAARDAAEAAGRARDEFLAVTSHELRTPLGALLIWTQLLRGERQGEEDGLSRPLAMIERSARSLAQLIDDLLDLSRIVSGRLQLDLRPLDLGPVVDAALRTVEAADEGRRVRLERAADTGVRAINGDSARLQLVIQHLLAAAVKAASPETLVSVRLEDGAGCVRLTVAGGDQPFEPGAVDARRESLRLTLGRRLAEMHGGSLEVAEVDGRGEVFRLTLPTLCAVASPDGDALGTVTGAARRALYGLRVLVVDDQADARDALALVLEQSGASVRAVASAEAALETLRSELPHVLFSDISMPHEDGYALIRRLRALPAQGGGGIPAAAVTAYATVRERERALLAGYSEHVSKPVDPWTLVDLAARLGRLGGWQPAPPAAGPGPRAGAG